MESTDVDLSNLAALAHKGNYGCHSRLAVAPFLLVPSVDSLETCCLETNNFRSMFNAGVFWQLCPGISLSLRSTGWDRDSWPQSLSGFFNSISVVLFCVWFMLMCVGVSFAVGFLSMVSNVLFLVSFMVVGIGLCFAAGFWSSISGELLSVVLTANAMATPSSSLRWGSPRDLPVWENFAKK